MTSRREFAAVLLAALATIFLAKDAAGENAEVPPLQLEAKIPLGDIRGRIDHMAADLARHRLFVAALGSDSLVVVDIEAQRLDRIIGELSEPQGVGYNPATDTLYVANAGDGSVRLFKGSDLSPGERINLGSDADNIRVDSKAGRVFIGYGDGALAIVDAVTNSPCRRIQRASSSTATPAASLSMYQKPPRSTWSIVRQGRRLRRGQQQHAAQISRWRWIAPANMSSWHFASRRS